jgi:hypothetical protein
MGGKGNVTSQIVSGIACGIDRLPRRGGTRRLPPGLLAHVVLVVPYLALMACPLMHLMHRGHHHHGARNADSNKT